MGRPLGVKNKGPQHIWSDEEKQYLAEITPGRGHKEIQSMMSCKFGFDYTYHQIKGAITRNKLNTGRTGRFEEGHATWNKGTKGLTKANVTSFKKGHKPHNYKPLGSERIVKDGYCEVKVSDTGRRWRPKHVLIYEKHHGKVPKGSAVIFLDGDKRNFDIDNLYLVTRSQLAMLNKNSLIQKDADLTKTAINVVDLMKKISAMEKKDK